MNEIHHIRSFFALSCDEELSRKLADHFKFLEVCPGVKPTPSHEYHITLKFLGKTPVDLLKKTEENLHQSIGQIPSFSLKLNTTGIFPRGSHPKILWIGNRHVPLPLQQIVLQLNLLFKDYGYPREERRFKPHVTLARVKGEVTKTCIEKFIQSECPPMVLQAKDIIWYESQLSSAGPEYIERMRIPLNMKKGR
ncbi:RNA 2',3'-cyclic phosphodiesterase [Fidelibacter multiformis]|uniref:RNA 2',3'-cyclic phosphodiesterase n=1 Tax=Fidelibacter multiformis TaxID=3377529 RepID=UPI0037DCD8E8